jgi:Uma2 family endonuclease
MSIARPLPDLTRTEDFLDWVWAQDHKFEEINGRLVMMAGGSRNHARISGNTYAALANRLIGKPCLPYNSDFLVEVAERNRYYPDVSVACDERRDYTDRPVLIVEVLSPRTLRADMGEKLEHYLRSQTLRYVLYLWQDEARARLWQPVVDRGGESVDVIGLDNTVPLPELGVALPMAELYRDVDFGLSEVD